MVHGTAWARGVTREHGDRGTCVGPRAVGRGIWLRRLSAWSARHAILA